MTYQCPQCRRDIRTLDDEYGDHGCPCGWEPYEEDDFDWDDDHYDCGCCRCCGCSCDDYNEGDDAE